MTWTADGRKGVWINNRERFRGTAIEHAHNDPLIIFEFDDAEQREADGRLPPRLIIYDKDFAPD